MNKCEEAKSEGYGESRNGRKQLIKSDVISEEQVCRLWRKKGREEGKR